VFLDLPDLIGKWFIEFLKTIVPSLSRVGVVCDPATGRAQHMAASAVARSIAHESTSAVRSLREEFPLDLATEPAELGKD